MNKRLCRCGQPMLKVKKTISRNINNQEITIYNVPALYCEQCKQTLFSARTVKKMDELIRKFPGKKVFEYPNFPSPSDDAINILKKLGIDDLSDDSEQPVNKWDIILLSERLQSLISA
ncbi:MAG TPA: YgiT-type zinc finger protein [Syntrophomonadaceae bacterium]|nr:YgiT-type zinc finger protein [Syntrophomonadaceae bacterium]